MLKLVQTRAAGRWSVDAGTDVAFRLKRLLAETKPLTQGTSRLAYYSSYLQILFLDGRDEDGLASESPAPVAADAFCPCLSAEGT